MIKNINSKLVASHCRYTIQVNSRRFFSQQSHTDYFQIMGLQQSFKISQQDLKHLYKEHMKILHPDKHTLKSLEKQESTAKLASEVTRGYEVLKDDYERSLHLLELNGNKMDEDISGDILGNDFLMNIMELREQTDGTDDVTELKKLLAENQGRIDETCEELAVAFGNDDLDEAKRLAAKLQYWNRIRETILEKI
jgi:molecular chaperone HscB